MSHFLLVSKKLTTLRTFRLTEEWAHHSSSAFTDHLFLNNDVIGFSPEVLLAIFQKKFENIH